MVHPSATIIPFQVLSECMCLLATIWDCAGLEYQNTTKMKHPSSSKEYILRSISNRKVNIYTPSLVQAKGK